MPLRIDRKCKVCRLIDGGDEVLLRRLYNSSKFIKGGETLKNIQADYAKRYADDNYRKFSYISLVNHMKYHQGPSDVLLENTAQRLEKKLTFGEVQDIVMKKGIEQIESGEMKLNPSSVMQAASQKQNYELKQQDREDSFMKMLWGYASEEQRTSALEDNRREIADSTIAGGDNPAGSV